MTTPKGAVSATSKPERWSDPASKIFPHQVGFTAPPHDFDAAPTDFLRIAPETVGVHGRLLHVPGYAHQLKQRAANFHLLEEVVQCMSNAGADVVGQVGTNWVHCNGTTPAEIHAFCERLSDKYETPFHMAGMCLVEGLLELNVERITVNAVYYWPDWRDGIVRFLKEAGFDVLYYGNFVDQGIYETQDDVNALTWVFPGEAAARSMTYAVEQAPDVDAVVVTGMPNWRRSDGLPERTVSLAPELEAAIGKPIVSSDFALYWRVFKTLGVAPVGTQGRLLSTLQK